MDIDDVTDSSSYIQQRQRRYIRWIEDYYPALGASADLADTLYRCVREISRVEGIHNDPVYVGTWLKIINFCDSKLELFSLLFGSGVGTLCANFYVAWIDLILATRSTTLISENRIAEIATILGHGLRAGAQPLTLLGDRTESFIRAVEGSNQLRQEERAFHEVSSQPIGDTAVAPTRQVLSTLRPGEGSTGVPSIRTGLALDADQRGLRGLRSRFVGELDRQGQPSQKPSGLQVFRDPLQTHCLGHLVVPAMKQVHPDALTVTRLVDPLSKWNAENTTKSEATLDHRATNSSDHRVGSATVGGTGSVEPASRTQVLTVYRDDLSRTDLPISQIQHHGQRHQFVSSYSRGLHAVGECDVSSAPGPDVPLLSLDSLKLVLSGGPVDNSAGVSVLSMFFCDLDTLHLDTDDEVCFEMNKAKILQLNSSPRKYNPDSFCPSLDDEQSQHLMHEIAELVSGNTLIPPEPTQADTRTRQDYLPLLEKLQHFLRDPKAY